MSLDLNIIDSSKNKNMIRFAKGSYLIYKKIKNQIDFNKKIQLLFNWPLWHFELHKTLLFLKEQFLSHLPEKLHFNIPCPPHIECRLLISLRPEYLTNQQDHDRHLVLELEPCLQP
ncbi:hypothetical protein BpHYR1_051224 [Brachionus plicatilis]|uniref:Uncharacterized protein n=1 Tax=Brachionus plicatilis TaxID=10195 RepID=A0A3M7SXD7_BRAPC|nr:hypothetical protein BpHYR1_051224 [Brachionus plicatilis]